MNTESSHNVLMNEYIVTMNERLTYEYSENQSGVSIERAGTTIFSSD